LADASLVTYRDLIAANRRASAILVACMLLLFALVGSAVAVAVAARGGGEVLGPAALTGAIAALATGGLVSAWSWFGGGRAILRMVGARPIRKEDDPQLFNVVEELAISGGLPLPEIWIIDDPALNAFATGRDPAHAAVAITRGLREQLTRDELAGVMAHELAHVRSYDIRFAMLMATMVGMVAFASEVFLRVGLRAGGRGSGGGKGGNPVALVLLVVAVVFLILSPFAAMAIRMAFSRKREYLADAGAVDLTRDPRGIISALRKLGASRTPVAVHNAAIAPLYMVEPAKARREGRPEKAGLFDTHPPLAERIRRLEALL
jgi:heat shock protein HtpX